jgi:hypothetical protein
VSLSLWSSRPELVCISRTREPPLSNWESNNRQRSEDDDRAAQGYGLPRQPTGNRETGLSLLLGMFLPLPLLLLQIPLLFVNLIALPLMGITQVLYIVPLVLLCRSKGRSKLAMGLIIGASILFLLSASCLGLLLISSGLSNLTVH